MRWCENRDDCKREKLDGKQCGCHLFSRTKTGAPWEHEANPGDKITAIADVSVSHFEVMKAFLLRI
jgi:hypothetical protein